MLDARNISVSYGQHRALEQASVRVGPGETVVILGANGAGKSSLLKAICGICEGNVDGHVTISGSDVTAAKPEQIVEAGISLVPEGRGIFPELTVRENLALGAYSAHARDGEKANLERIWALFPILRERQRQLVRTMSGGEQQMVAIGRAMMSSPSILLLDEPSLGLSPILCKSLFQSLSAVRETGIGILLVEQNARQSLAIADRGYILENGTIVKEASASELKNDPAVQRAYLGAAGAAAPAITRKVPAPSPAPGTEPIPVSYRADNAPGPQEGASPKDIAAAAIARFSSKASSANDSSTPATAKAARPVPQTVPPRPTPTHAPSPSPAAANGSKSASGSPHGIEIDNMVARANARSAETFKSARHSGGGAHQRINGGPATVSTSRPADIPDLTSSADRLSTVLAEIESAAEKARKYRPPGGKN